MNEARRLLAWASDRHLPIISDEVFLDYKWSADPAIVDTLCAFPEILSFSLGGLSKSAAMPQMKLGWIVVNGPQSELEQLWPRLDLILDTYLSVNWPVQSALASFLTIGRALREQLSDTIRTNLASLHSEVANTPLHVLNTEGGWTAILQLPRICSEQEWINDLLRHESILVQPGYFFDMPTEPYIVISLITPAATFNTGLQHLVHYVRERTN
jgi:aspartate/methionine/tyrosine aminotransferase